MLEMEIPGFGHVKVKHVVSDFTGTVSVDGNLLPGVLERLTQLATKLQIHIVTADTFGTARKQLENVPCEIHILNGTRHDIQKEKYVAGLKRENVIALGNGNNDRRMLKRARIGIAVTEGEGCSVDAIKAAHIHVRGIIEGLDLLLNPLRLKATLRY